MMHAYDKIYLDKARTALARMLDFAVYELNYDLEEFWNLFLTTGIASRFGEGDFSLLAGKSGIEISYEILDEAGLPYLHIEPCYTVNRSEEYWTGWALAYYQWETGLSFKEITRVIPIKEILALYSPYHEMDIRHFVDKMNYLYREANPDTNLKRIRKLAGLSQGQLAKEADIPVRTIQQYEQRQKNINKAQVEYLVRLAGVLGCEVEVLVERV